MPNVDVNALRLFIICDVFLAKFVRLPMNVKRTLKYLILGLCLLQGIFLC